MKLLFMCVANSARSQLAEGLAKQLFGERAEVESAGSHPSRVNPLSIQALKEIGVDISDHTSKAVEDLPRDFLRDLDYVITLCAEEVCPMILSKAAKLHWPHPDPGGGIQGFRQARDSIKRKLEEFGKEHGLL